MALSFWSSNWFIITIISMAFIILLPMLQSSPGGTIKSNQATAINATQLHNATTVYRRHQQIHALCIDGNTNRETERWWVSLDAAQLCESEAIWSYDISASQVFHLGLWFRDILLFAFLLLLQMISAQRLFIDIYSSVYQSYTIQSQSSACERSVSSNLI